MNILAIIGSYRKGKTIDTIVDKAIEGVKANKGTAQVERIHLVDKNIEYCKNCMVCRKDDPEKKIARCIISDDMDIINPKMNEADGFIFATPVNMGQVTAVMKTFLERTTWVLSKPGKRPIHGCPTPRSTRKKKAIIIVSSGIIPPLLRRWCDDATSLIKSQCDCIYNAQVVGSMYAGAVEKRGVDVYMEKAYKLGRKLAS
jgi:multimeric flavodoxin WrbA